MLQRVSDSDIFSTIESITQVVAKTSTLKFSAESNFLSDLGLSSLSMVMLLTEVCERLKLNIFNFSESDLSGVKTVRDMVELLKTKG